MSASHGSLALIVVLLIAFLVYFDTEEPSPGPISPVHAQLESLVSRKGCTRCHGGTDFTMAESCLACHQAIGHQLRVKKGLHGMLPSADGMNCKWCHLEHRGDDFQLIGPRSFNLAGFPDEFEHQGFDFKLVGKHMELECRACHPMADVKVLPRGKLRFLGRSQACTVCHKDRHDGKLPDCESCHGQEEPFDQVANFVHTDRFPLVGGHEGRACAQCHAEGTRHSVDHLAELASRDRDESISVRDCIDCHEPPHSSEFVDGVSELLATPRSKTCSLCHQPKHGSFLGVGKLIDREIHEATTFSLTAPHDKAKCGQCHEGMADSGDTVPTEFSFAKRFPGRSPDDCGSCHTDAHQGQFEEGAWRGHRCLDCHVRSGFRPPTFTPDKHQKNRFPLTGAHIAVGCIRCHLLPEQRRMPLDEHPKHQIASGEGTERLAFRIFRGTPRYCDACHEDAHDKKFDRPDLPQTFEGEIGCARCHVPDAFSEVDREKFNHGLWTGFPREGAHAKAECEQC
ncbi:MAG: hypothetical protein ACE5F1_18575, partial [Planctomycetota bacterium]